MIQKITAYRIRAFVGKSLQGHFNDDTGGIIFDNALHLNEAMSKSLLEIEATIQASFSQIITYGKKIQDHVEARDDVKGKFA